MCLIMGTRWYVIYLKHYLIMFKNYQRVKKTMSMIFIEKDGKRAMSLVVTVSLLLHRMYMATVMWDP